MTPHARVSAAGSKVAVAPSWIFIHSTDIVDRGLIVLFFGLFFAFPHLEIFLAKPLVTRRYKMTSVNIFWTYFHEFVSIKVGTIGYLINFKSS